MNMSDNVPEKCFYPKCRNKLDFDRVFSLVNKKDPTWSFMPANSFMHLECYISMKIEEDFVRLMKEYEKNHE